MSQFLYVYFDQWEEVAYTLSSIDSTTGLLVEDSTGSLSINNSLGERMYEVPVSDYIFYIDAIKHEFPTVLVITLNLVHPNGTTQIVSSYNGVESSTENVFAVSSSSASVDLTPITNQMLSDRDFIVTAVHEVLASVVSVQNALSSVNVDLTPVIDLLTPLQTAELNNLHEDIVSLGTQLSTVSVPLQSLNGNGSEYKDGVQVSVTGRSIPYTVSRSYMSLMNTDTYTIVYDLTSADGSKVTCPESFLTLYVAPVVTP